MVDGLKIELEIRNAERTASSSTDTSRVLDKMKVCVSS